MTRRYIAWVASAALLPLAGAGSALAQAPVQAVGQDNASSQSASSGASSTQIGAQNRNISVRVLSPGNDGDVTQSNSSSADSSASNNNETRQSAAQQALGAAEQLIGQANANHQSADSDATSKQVDPKNDNIVVRVLSPGNGGDVTQSNSSSAGSTATNGNSTSQTASQQATGSGCGCHPAPAPAPTVAPVLDPHPAPPAHHEDSATIQAIGQENQNSQHADSDATSEQYHPQNQNISVRVLSPGHDGDVTQSNSSSADSSASNANSTNQSATQQAGSGPVMVADGVARERDPGHCGCGGDVLQLIGQANANAQRADSEAASKQAGASNSNVPVAIGGWSGGGDVTQSNDSSAESSAGNRNATTQSATQQAGGGRECGCRHGGLVIQAIGQENGNRQSADSDASSWQKDPSNENGSLDVGGYGGHGEHGGPMGPLERVVRKLGHVTQSNSSDAKSGASNSNGTGQSAQQSA